MACSDYCATVMAQCTGASAQYPSLAACEGVCAHLPSGVDTPNGLACRNTQAGLAASDPTLHCPAAGPAGDGVCGGNCASFCALADQVCPGQFPNGCAADCPELGLAMAHYADGSTSGSTFACHLHYLSLAAVDGPSAAQYCPEIGFSSTMCR
jgi:hypothetical protein